MRGLRFVGRAAILTVFVLSSLAARAGDGKIHRMPEKVPNSYIVMLYKGQHADAIGPELEKRHGGKVEAIMKELDMFSIQLPNEAAAEGIAHDPRVAEVQEDGILHVQGCDRPLDPSGSQWALGHLNYPMVSSSFSDQPGVSINLFRVYIIDGAINPSWCVPSTDLTIQPSGNSKVQETQNFVESPGSRPGFIQIPSVSSISSHGTAVASVLAGNTYGVVPELLGIVSLVVVNDANGTATDNAVLQAGNYAIATHPAGHPAVANVSLGAQAGDDALDSTLTKMVDNGIFVAAAAGNGDPSSHYGTDACSSSPGRVGGTSRYPGLMVVGATDYDGYPTTYSNFGACVDTWTPGGDSYYHQLATSVGSGWGTSFAAPEVAGAAVLLYSSYPSWTPADVWSQLKYLESYWNRGVRTLLILGCNSYCTCPPPGPTQ